MTTEIGKRVDKAAKAAAKRGGFDKDTGYKPGAVSRSMVKGGIAVQYPASGQIAVIRPYAKKPVVRTPDTQEQQAYGPLQPGE